MKEIFNYILASFDNSNDGASARKLTAFALMNCIAYLHIKHVDNNNSIYFHIVDLVGVGVLLGIITIEQIIKFKNGNKDNENNEIK
jgi:multisubunit Na+/H+ antiporter MnhB subunit